MSLLVAVSAEANSTVTNVTGTAGVTQVALSWTAPTSSGFNVGFNGTTYNSVFIGSNTYITFGGGSSAYSSLSASNPPLPGVHICSKDNSYQRVQFLINNSVTPNQLRIRYEGNNTTSGTVGSPTIVYEAVFYRDQNYFDLLIGSNSACAQGGLRTITNGSSALSTPSFGANTNWRITGGTATLNGNTANWLVSGSGSSTLAPNSNGFTSVQEGSIDDASVQIPAATASPSGYAIRYSTDNINFTQFTANTNSTSTSATVTGLAIATTYYFQVAPVTSGIPGTWSSSSSAITTKRIPSAITVSTGAIDSTGEWFNGTWYTASSNTSNVTPSSIQTQLGTSSATLSSTGSITVSNSVAGSVSGRQLILTTSGGDVSVNATVSNAGPISMVGTNINAAASLTASSSGAPISLQARNSITLSASQKIQTNGGHVILWSDSDSSAGGVIRLLSDSEICTTSGTCGVATTGGGDVVLGGGAADPNNPSRPGGMAAGFGTAAADNAGVQIGTLLTSNAGSRIYSAGGLISIRGTTTTNSSATYVHGVVTVANSVINSGSGNILIEGTAQFANTAHVRPVAFSVSASSTNDTKIISTNTSATAVVIRSYGVGGQNGHAGLGFGAKVDAEVSGGFVVEADRIQNGMLFEFGVAGPIEIKPYGTTLLSSVTNTGVFEFAFGSGGGFKSGKNPSSIVIGSSVNTSPITVSSNLQTTSGNIEILTNGAILKTTSTLTAAADLIATSRGSSVDLGSGSISASNVRISPNTTYAGSAPLTASNGVIQISGGSAVTLTGALQATGNISISGSTNFSNSTTITSSAGNILVTTSGSGTAVVTGNVQATTGSIAFNTAGAYSGAGTLTAGTTVSVASAGVTIGGNVVAGGNATYTSNGSLTQNANVTSNSGNVSMNISGANATYSKNSASTISASQEASITSAASTVNTTGTGTISAGTVRLASSSTMTSNAPITSRGTVEISSSAGDTTVSGAVSAAGNTSVVGGAVTVSSAITTTAGGNLTISPRAGYSGSGALTAAGTLTLSAGTTITPTGSISASSNITITGSGIVTLNGITVQSTSGQVSVSAGPAAGNTLVVQNSIISATTQRIRLSATSTSAQGIFIHSGSRLITTSGDIEIVGSGADWGVYFQAAEVLSSSGDITIDGGVGGIVVGHNTTVTTFGATSSGSASGDITILGDRYWNGTHQASFKTIGHVVLTSKASTYASAPSYYNHTFTGASSVSIGNLNDTFQITVDADGEINGPFNVYGGYIYLENGTSMTVNRGASLSGPPNIGVLAKATDRVYVASGVKFETKGSDIVFWSDADNNGVGAHYFAGSNILKSNGGDITIAGGLDDGGVTNTEFVGRIAGDGHPDNYAAGVSGWGENAGVEFLNSYQVLSGGGDIFVAGRGSAASTDNDMGISFRGGLIYSGSGKIAAYGKAPASCSAYSHRGIIAGWTAQTSFVSESSDPDAIYLYGNTLSCNNTTSVYASAIEFHDSNFANVVTPNGGGINIYGIQGNASNDPAGDLQSSTLQLRYVNLISNSGPITVHAATAASGPWAIKTVEDSGNQRTFGGLATARATGYAGYPTIAAVASSSDITLKADSILPWWVNFRTTGNVQLIPNTTFESAKTHYFSSDWGVTFPFKMASFTAGSAATANTAQTSSDIDLAALSASGPVKVYGGAITQEGTISSDDDVTLSGTKNITLGHAVTAGDALSIQTSGGDITVSAATTAGAGGVAIESSGATTIGGAITSVGPVSAVANGLSSNLTINANATVSGPGNDLLLKSKSSVFVSTAGSTLQTAGKSGGAGGRIVLWSDSDASGQGFIRTTRNVTLNSIGGSESTFTGGGDIHLAGGLDNGSTAVTSRAIEGDGLPDGWAISTSATVNFGVEIGADASSSSHISKFYSGGGNITILGKTTATYDATAFNWTTRMDSGQGQIEIQGDSAGWGLQLNRGGDADTYTNKSFITSRSNSDPAIYIKGKTSGNSSYVGLLGSWHDTGTDNLLIQAVGSGGVHLVADAPNALPAMGLASTAILSSSGNITLEGGSSGSSTTGGIHLGQIRSGHSQGSVQIGACAVATCANSLVPSSSANITLTASRITTGGTGSLNTTISSTGTASFLPASGSSAFSEFQTKTAGITLPTNLGGLVIGRAGDTTSGMKLEKNWTIAGPITVNAQSLEIPSAITSSGSSIELVADTLALTGNVSAAASFVSIQPASNNRAVNLGTEVGTELSLTKLEVEKISTNVLRFTTGGDIKVTDNLSLTGKVNSLALRASGNVSANSGVAVVVSNLGIDAGGSITWPGSGNNSAVVALNAGSSGTVSFGQSANYSVSTVDGIDPEFGQGVKFVVENIDRTNTLDRFMAVTFNPPPVVKIQDKYGNVLASNNLSAANYAVNAALSVSSTTAGTPTLSGNSTTRSGGTHTFTNLRVVNGTGNVSISFTVTRSDNFALVDSDSAAIPQATFVAVDYVIKAGEPTSLTVTFSATTTRAGEPDLRPSVKLLDSEGNQLTTGDLRNTKVTVSITGDTGRILSGDDVTTVDGLALFPDLEIAGKISTTNKYTLTFSVTYTNSLQQVVTKSVSQEITLIAGAATKLALSSTSQTVASRATLSDIEVSIQDDFENLVATAKDIEVSVSTGASFGQSVTFTGTRNRSTPALVGSVTYSGLVLQGRADNYTLTFTASGVSSTTHTVRLSHGDASYLSVSAPTTAANDRSFSSAVVVDIFDLDGNLVNSGPQSTQTVSLSASTTLTGTREISATAGRASFSGLKLVGLVGQKTLTASISNPATIQEQASILLGFGDATKLALTTQAAGIANRITFSSDPVITVQDSSGNTVEDYAQQIVVDAADVVPGTSATLTGTRTLTPSNGVATFTDLELQGEVGQYDLVFSSGALDSLPQRVSLNHGTATTVSLTGATSSVNRELFATDIVATIKDFDGNTVTTGPASYQDVVITSDDAELSGTTTRPASGGIATFDDLKLTGSTGAKTIKATISVPSTLIGTRAIDLAHGAATSVELLVQATAINNVVISDVVVRIKDADGNLVTTGSPEVSLVGSAPELTGTLTRNASQGVATLDNLRFLGTAGSKSVTAYVSSLSLNSLTSAVNVSAGAATQLVLTTSATGAVNRAGLSQVPVVTFKDISGNTVLNETESVAVAISPVGSTTASLSGTVSRTPSSGVVSFTGLGLNGQVGQYTLTFSSAGLSSITQTIDLSHGAAVKLGIGAASATARAGLGFATQSVIRVLDQDDNLVTTGDQSSSVIDAALTGLSDPAPVTLLGDRDIQAVKGEATFPDLRLTGTVGNYTISYSSGSLTAASQPIQLLAGNVASLKVTSSPQNAIAGEGFSSAVEVELVDAYDNVVLSDSATDITATLVSSSDVSSRAVTATTVRVASGVADFSALNYTLVGDHKISFTDGTRTTVSDSFTITHASANKLVWVSQPGSMRNDIVVGIAPSVRILDEFNNPVLSGPAVEITASVVSSNSADISAITGNTESSTSGTELVSLPDLKLRGKVSDYVIRLSASVSGSVFSTLDSDPTALTFGLPYQIALTRDADGARAGVAFDIQPIIEIRDNEENLVADSNLRVTATVAGRALVGTSSVSASAGIASFQGSGLGIQGQAATGLVIRFAADYLGTELATTQEIDLTAGDAVKLAMIQEPETVLTKQEFTNDVSVQLLDEFNNPVPTDSTSVISLEVFKGLMPAVPTAGSSFTYTSERANAGVVVFEGLRLPVAPASDYFLKFTLGSFTVTSAQFEVLPGAVASIVINQQPEHLIDGLPVATGELLPGQPEVTLYDADGYLAEGATGSVSVAISSGVDGDLSEGSVSATVTDGVARFSGVRLVGTPSQLGVAAENYQLRFSFTNELGVVINSVESEILNVTNTRASKLVLHRGAADGDAGLRFETQPIVYILDRYDNIVETGVDANLEIIASSPTADTVTANDKVATSGVATFANLALGGQVNTNYSLVFEAVNRSDITSVTQSNIQVGFGSQTKLRIVTQPASLSGSEPTKSGSTLATQPVIEILDAYNNRVTDSNRQISVTLVREGTSLDPKDRLIATVATPSNGVATFSGLAVVGRPGDTYKLSFTGTGLTGVTSQGLVVRHGDPTTLEFVNQPVSLLGGALTKTGSLLAGQPKLRLLDFDGNVATEINGVSVSAAVLRGGGYTVTELDANSVPKNTASFENGVATFENLMVVATPGSEQVLRFETLVRGATLQSPESQPLTFTNADPYQLAILTQPCAGAVVAAVCEPGITGDDLSVNPVIEIQDRFGNRAVDFNGVITVSTTNNRGQLSDQDLITVNEITVQASAGVASFEDLNLVAIPGEEIELLFTSGTLNPVTSDPITVRAAAATSIAVITQPVGARTGSQLAIAPVVELRDRFGNRAASDDASRITVVASGGTLSGTKTITATAGRVTFSDLEFIGVPGLPYSLTFTGVDAANASLTGISTDGFTVKNALANRLVITQQPTANRTGDLLTETVLELRDFDNNLAEDDSATVVRVAIHGGDGNAYFVDATDTRENYSTTSTILRQAASGGVVRFSDLRVVGTPGVSYQLIFTANPDDVSSAYDSAPSNALTLIHAEPSALEVTAWPAANLTDEALTNQPALRLLDRYGNLATLDSTTVVSVSVVGATGGVVRSGGTATSSAGIVTFEGLTVAGTPGELYKLRFQAGSITVDEAIGFRLKKVADIAMSFDAVSYSPSLQVTRNLSVALTDSPGTPVYSSTSAASICTVNSSTGVVTVNGVGDCMVRVTIADTTYYTGGSLNALLVINKAQQATLSMSSASNVPYLSTLRLEASGGSGTGRLIFSTSGDCRAVSGILITGDAGSECLVRVDKLGDDNYLGQVSSFQAITVTKLNQALLQIGNPREVSVGDVNLFTHGGSGTGAVSYEVVSVNNEALCTIISDTVLRAAADGDCYVIATKAASTNYNAAPSPSKRFTFTKAKQNVVFSSSVPTLPLAGGDLYKPVATASSGLAVTYSITSGSGTVCEFDALESDKVRFLTSGNCEITATQAGNAQYGLATAKQVIAVGLRNQTITFAAIDNRRFGEPAFMLSATASSGLSVSYQLDSSVASQACSVTTAGLVSITQAGTCAIKASQPGNSLFQAAPEVTRSFTVNPDRAGAPHLVSVSASDQTITATFTAPSYLGGSTISRYVMEVSMVDSDNVFMNFACQANPLIPCELAGLPNANNESYTVRVAAVTAAGIGAYSRSSEPLSTAVASAAVSNLTASSTSTTLNLAWEEPIAIPGTFESYEVYVWPMNDTQVPENPTVTVTDPEALGTQIGLTVPSGGGQSLRSSAPSVLMADGYNIKVVTITDGMADAMPENTSNGMKIGFTTPGSPSAIALTDLTEKVLVGWSPPTFDGGHEILGYQVMVNGEVACVMEAAGDQEICEDSDQRVFELADIEIGVEYEIEVAAVNELGIGSMAVVEHLIPRPVATGRGGGATLPDTITPGKPGKPSKPDTGTDGPNLFDPDSWNPLAPGEGDTGSGSGQDLGPIAPVRPEAPDTSASSQAAGQGSAFDWLIWLLIAFGVAAGFSAVFRFRRRKSAVGLEPDLAA